MKRIFPLLALLALVTLLVSLPWSRSAHAQTETINLGVNGFNCVVPVSTATTIQAVGGSCIAPGASVRLYITDVEFGTNASGIAADSFPTLKTGTGGTCGTGTTVIWQAFTPAAAQAQQVVVYKTPIRLPLNSELCWINTTAGSKVLQVHGFIGQ
jgi:hypothetical protein